MLANPRQAPAASVRPHAVGEDIVGEVFGTFCRVKKCGFKKTDLGAVDRFTVQNVIFVAAGR